MFNWSRLFFIYFLNGYVILNRKLYHMNMFPVTFAGDIPNITSNISVFNFNHNHLLSFWSKSLYYQHFAALSRALIFEHLWVTFKLTSCNFFQGIAYYIEANACLENKWWWIFRYYNQSNWTWKPQLTAAF